MASPVVLFDLDGTLTDPGVGIFRSVRHACAELGLPEPDTGVLHGFIGPPLQDSFAGLGLDDGDVARAVALYRDCYRSGGLFDIEVYPGVPEALVALRDEGFDLAVATSKPTVFAGRVLEHAGLAGHFAALVGSELDGSRRHKHEIIAACLVALDRDPADVVAMVGDRVYDVRGSAEHGIAAVGVTWGYGTVAELADAGASALVDDPSQLLGTLLELGRPTPAV